MNYMPETVTELEVNPNDPHVQKTARELTEALLRNTGLGDSIGILLVSLEAILTGVLHATAPVPESNVAAVRVLLDSLVLTVLQHEECALSLNGSKKEKVH